LQYEFDENLNFISKHYLANEKFVNEKISEVAKQAKLNSNYPKK